MKIALIGVTGDVGAHLLQEALDCGHEVTEITRHAEGNSPSALLLAGERTGQFRIGSDQLLSDAEGISCISLQDLALALIDELESPRHSRRRFTVGY